MSDQNESEWKNVSSEKVHPKRQPSDVTTNSRIATIDENKITQQDDELSYAFSNASRDLSEESASDDVILHKTQKGPIDLDDFSMNNGLSRMKAHWKVVVAGQCLSLFLAIAGASTSALYLGCDMNIPASQTFLVYLMMSFHVVVLIRQDKGSNENEKKSLCRIFDPRTEDIEDEGKSEQDENPHDEIMKKESSHYLIGNFVPISVPSWTYAALAFIKVEADFFTYLALSYTTLTSTAIFDNVSILSALICSRVFLKRHYKAPHLIGAAICILGVTINLVSDYEEHANGSESKFEEKKYPNPMLGAFFAVIGGLLLGVGDVATESIVKGYATTTHEYIGCVGIFGSLILFIQSYVLEMDDIEKFFASEDVDRMLENQSEFSDMNEDPMTCGQKTGLYLLAGFVFSNYFFTTGTCYFLAESEAALLSISVLTEDLWTVLFSAFVGIAPSFAFYVAFVMVIIGLITYEMAPSPLSGELDHLDISDGMSLHESKSASKGLNIPPGNVLGLSNMTLSWDVDEKRTQPELL